MFFYRSDSDDLALGLNSAQWTSLALLVVAGIGAYLTSRAASAPRETPMRRATRRARAAEVS